MSIAVVFAGQGAQSVGMGKELYATSPAARAVFDLAGAEIKEYCFEGPGEVLNRTDVTQPCVFTADLAAYGALCERLGEKFMPAMLAGFSLGEMATLTAAGVFAPESGLAFVRKRALWMHEASLKAGGGMAAMIGPADVVEQCCAEAGQYGLCVPVNYNCPGQIVVAGETGAMEKLPGIAKQNRIKCIPLKVSGAFHTPLMAPAAEQMEKLLELTPLGTIDIPVYSNVTALVHTQEELHTMIPQQAMSPVRWEQILRNMAAAGADVFIEVGPGKTLQGFIKRTLPQVRVFGVENMATLAETAEALLEWVDRC